MTPWPRATIAVPGTLTTAYLALRMCLGNDFTSVVVPFDRILDAVAAGHFEGQADRRRPGHPRGPAHLRSGRTSCWSPTWGSGGSSKPACRCPWAPTSFARTSARSHPRRATLLKASIEYGLDHRAGGPRLRPRLRPRPGPGRRGPIRGDVRQRLDVGFRPSRAAGGGGAFGPGPRRRRDSLARGAGVCRRLRTSP